MNAKPKDKLIIYPHQIKNFNIKIETKQDAWLIRDGYIESDYIRFTGPLSVNFEVIIKDTTLEDKLVVVIDRDKIQDNRIFWKADCIFELNDLKDGFYINKHRYMEYDHRRIKPYPIQQLGDFISVNKNGKQDAWLATGGYV
jgi:hypothetical protein